MPVNKNTREPQVVCKDCGLYYKLSIPPGGSFPPGTALPGDKPVITEFSYRDTPSDRLLRTLSEIEQAGFRKLTSAKRYFYEYEATPVPKPEGYTLRVANVLDADEIFSLLSECLDPVKNQLPGTDELRCAVTQGNVICAAIGERIAGALLSDYKTNHVYIKHSCVAPEYRRQGIITALNLLHFHIAENRGIKRHYAYIEESNTASSAMCQKLGFLPDGKIIETYIKQ